MSTRDITVEEEHERAIRKHSQWIEEIAQWKRDHQRALGILAEATEFVTEHDALLDHHAELIAEHDRELREHAAVMNAGEDAEDNPAHAAAHKRLEEAHVKVLEQHNRFRGRHPALIQEITRLAVELHKVSHQPG